MAVALKKPKVCFYSPCPVYKRTFYDIIAENWNLNHSPGYLSFDLISRIASPYDLNPLNNNPLKDILIEQIDIERVRSCVGVKLFIDLNSVLD